MYIVNVLLLINLFVVFYNLLSNFIFVIIFLGLLININNKWYFKVERKILLLFFFIILVVVFI